jgi:hypothetical protein
MEPLVARLTAGDLSLRREKVRSRVEGLCQDILVCEHASELEVAHGEVAWRVLLGDEAVLDVCKEGGSPQDGWSTGDKPYAAHAWFCCIGCTNTSESTHNWFVTKNVTSQIIFV